MKTPIVVSAFSALISLYSVTPALAESYNEQTLNSEVLTSASPAPTVYQSERPYGAKLPAAQTENGITFVTGGISKTEANAMKAAAKHYDTMLIFADRGGHYLADVKVQIKDRNSNTVLDIVSDPILLANLPSDRYTVHADARGYNLVKTINLSSKRPVQFVYRWPVNFDERGVALAGQP